MRSTIVLTVESPTRWRSPLYPDRGRVHGTARRGWARRDDPIRICAPIDPAPASLQARARDCLGRVVDDVHEYLLDLIRVHLDFRQPRLEAERQLDARREQLVLEELVRRLEDRPDRLQLALAFLAARERQQVAHDGRGAFRLLSDHRE